VKAGGAGGAEGVVEGEGGEEDGECHSGGGG